MSEDILTLEELDRDGAIRETAEQAASYSRGDALRRGALASGGVLGGSAVLGLISASPASAAGLPASDIAILNFALTLEYLEAAFYAEALRKGSLNGRALKFAKVVARHEAQHVSFLKKVLGGKAVAKPTFNFKGTTAQAKLFLKTSQVLEDTGVAAYKGQAPLIKSPVVLKAALSVHTVEARHASWVRHIQGQLPAPAAFDLPKTKAQVLTAVKGTGFIQ